MIVFQTGNFDVRTAEFGSGRFKPKSSGYEVCKNGATHAVVVGTFSGPDAFKKAKGEAERRHAVDLFKQLSTAGKIGR